MKKVLIPKIEVNDEIAIRKPPTYEHSDVKTVYPEVRARIIQVSDQFCAVNKDYGDAEKFDGKYLFLSVQELILTIAKEYDIYVED